MVAWIIRFVVEEIVGDLGVAFRGDVVSCLESDFLRDNCVYEKLYSHVPFDFYLDGTLVDVPEERNWDWVDLNICFKEAVVSNEVKK